jgi:hypothetical protein
MKVLCWKVHHHDAKSIHFTKGLIGTFDECAAVNNPEIQRLEEICNV